MKKLILTLTIALFLPLTTQAAFIINETFTTGSRPAGWWVGSNGDYAYATSPAPLEGTYSLQYTAASGQGLYIHGSEVASETWGAFMLNVPTLPDAFQQMFQVSSSGFVTLLSLTLNSNGSMTLASSGAFETTDTGIITANTTAYIWWRYKPSTGGNNGQLELWVNSTNDRASTPAGNHKVYNSGTNTAGISSHAFLYGTGSGPKQLVVDVAQWADTDEFAGGGGGGGGTVDDTYIQIFSRAFEYVKRMFI